MIEVSEIKSDVPAETSGTQALVYERLQSLGIAFERVECRPAAVSMDDCRAVEAALGCPVVKTVFLRNRQGTAHYLYATAGDAPFVTREFCGALGVPRVSFTSAEEMLERLGVEHGAATPLALVAAGAEGVRFVIDSYMKQCECIACPDGTSACYLRISTADLFGSFVNSTGHKIEMAG